MIDLPAGIFPFWCMPMLDARLTSVICMYISRLGVTTISPHLYVWRDRYDMFLTKRSVLKTSRTQWSSKAGTQFVTHSVRTHPRQYLSQTHELPLGAPPLAPNFVLRIMLGRRSTLCNNAIRSPLNTLLPNSWTSQSPRGIHDQACGGVQGFAHPLVSPNMGKK
jgi:hypothetical protein